MIVVYGALGKIGAIVVAELLRSRQEVLPVDIGLNQDHDLIEDCTLIWCATSPPPHETMKPFADDALAFINVLSASWQRVIFTSSFGIEDGNGVRAINPYAACKIASEAFLEAWCRGDNRRSGISIRMGGFGPLTPPGSPVVMSELEVVQCYIKALTMPHGFHVQRPLVERSAG
ncbi:MULTISPECIES: NAD(P)-dependent oxidoreductase [Rhizobium/Agrobacterium group]|uniref:NAD-dependent epimerase/dehydratase family protein n=1 Tax=Agrobacterium vitis TaxID=373 RepID=A0ABD6H5P3_AGRVI|nr:MULTISPECIES: NAD(P)-dependent oxidoreductase [Rhizobium/Agrobacterium group]MUO27408.1 hypothetical protein [Agrobacterium vitis]MUO42141.1 hypothetical protein [Agrobacterium vitis]MUP09449.1 hypothetical protein [Agrobacterium vitis]